MTTIERDFAIVFNQRIDRPENMVPGDWYSKWQAFTDPVNYQEAFDEGVESVENELAEEIKDLEDENAELRSEISDLENEIERIKELEGLDY